MAFIYPSGPVIAKQSVINIEDRPVAILGDADFFRQVDVYKLALMGVEKCIRLWADYELLHPADAKLVRDFTTTQKSERNRLKDEIDRIKTDTAFYKSAKPGKGRRKSGAADPNGALRAELTASLGSYDPAEREAARLALEAM